MMNRFLSFVACPFAGRQTKAGASPLFHFKRYDMKKKKNETTAMNVTVPFDLRKAFKKACVERGFTIKAVITKAMEDFIAEKV